MKIVLIFVPDKSIFDNPFQLFLTKKATEFKVKSVQINLQHQVSLIEDFNSCQKSSGDTKCEIMRSSAVIIFQLSSVFECKRNHLMYKQTDRTGAGLPFFHTFVPEVSWASWKVIQPWLLFEFENRDEIRSDLCNYSENNIFASFLLSILKLVHQKSSYVDILAWLQLGWIKILGWRLGPN